MGASATSPQTPHEFVLKRHANPKPTERGKQALRRIAREAYPDLKIEFCSHGDLGGHRAPRNHTLAFRLRDGKGRLRSNVIWVLPQSLEHWTVDDFRNTVERSNGKH